MGKDPNAAEGYHYSDPIRTPYLEQYTGSHLPLHPRDTIVPGSETLVFARRCWLAIEPWTGVLRCEDGTSTLRAWTRMEEAAR